jgi:hypothetical protein
MQGRDVVAVQRGLHFIRRQLDDAGFQEPPVKGRYDQVMAKNVAIFQKDRGIEDDGVYNEKTHKALGFSFQILPGGKHHPAIDGFGVWLFERCAVVSARHRLKRAAMFAHGTAPWHYAGPGAPAEMQRKRMQGVRDALLPADHPIFEDCSSGFTWLCYVAGIPDPNNLGYNGTGFTGTMVGHGRQVKEPDIGDAVFYKDPGGGSAPGHVAMFLGDDRVWSHGSEDGPFIVDVHGHGTPIHSIRSYV